MPHVHASPILHQNKPSRESIFCDKAGGWCTKRALIMLNFWPKTIQNRCPEDTSECATARSACTLATASAIVCGACCPRTMGTASWKRKSNLPSTSGFQFVETAWNNFRPTSFWHLPALCHRQMGHNFIFLRIFVWHVVHGRGIYLGFTAQRHKTPLNL